MKTMAAFPALVKEAAQDLAPHRLVPYLQELAGLFHRYYHDHRIVDADQQELSKARLWLVAALALVLRNGLQLIGVSAPQSM